MAYPGAEHSQREDPTEVALLPGGQGRQVPEFPTRGLKVPARQSVHFEEIENAALNSPWAMPEPGVPAVHIPMPASADGSPAPVPLVLQPLAQLLSDASKEPVNQLAGALLGFDTPRVSQTSESL